jgi:hypothetical protein
MYFYRYLHRYLKIHINIFALPVSKLLFAWLLKVLRSVTLLGKSLASGCLPPCSSVAPEGQSIECALTLRSSRYCALIKSHVLRANEVVI